MGPQLHQRDPLQRWVIQDLGATSPVERQMGVINSPESAADLQLWPSPG